MDGKFALIASYVGIVKKTGGSGEEESGMRSVVSYFE